MGGFRYRISLEANQEQLADPLGFGHTGENPGRAGTAMLATTETRLRGGGENSDAQVREGVAPGAVVTARRKAASRAGQSERENAGKKRPGHYPRSPALTEGTGIGPGAAMHRRSLRAARLTGPLDDGQPGLRERDAEPWLVDLEGRRLNVSNT